MKNEIQLTLSHELLKNLIGGRTVRIETKEMTLIFTVEPGTFNDWIKILSEGLTERYSTENGFIR